MTGSFGVSGSGERQNLVQPLPTAAPSVPSQRRPRMRSAVLSPTAIDPGQEGIGRATISISSKRPPVAQLPAFAIMVDRDGLPRSILCSGTVSSSYHLPTISVRSHRLSAQRQSPFVPSALSPGPRHPVVSASSPDYCSARTRPDCPPRPRPASAPSPSDG